MADRRTPRLRGPRDPLLNRELVQASLRDLDHDAVAIMGGLRRLGFRVVQLVHEPSFDPGFAWDIRKREDAFTVYRSSVQYCWPRRTLLRGYTKLAVPSDTLETYWEEVCKLTVQLSPLLHTGEFILDGGEGFRLALFGDDLLSSVHFTWRSECPPNWLPLDEIARDMIDTFRQAAEIGKP